MPQHEEGFYNIPQNPYGKGISDFLKGTKGALNKNFGIPGIDIGIGLGDILLGESPEYVEELSHGADIWKGKGFGGRLDARAGDVLGLAGLLGNAPKNLAKGIYKGIAKDNLFGMPKGMMQSQQGYIMGLNSDLADIAKWGKATIMRSSGVGVDEIYKKTGWWLEHPDGKPRFEIAHGNEELLSKGDLADEYFRLEDLKIDYKIQGEKLPIAQGRRKAQLLRLDEGKGKFKDKLINSPVEEHYPEYFKSIRYQKETDPRNAGSFTVANKKKGRPPTIRLDEEYNMWNPREEIQTAQHEVQHAISRHESFAPGGSGEYVRDYIEDQAKNIIKFYNKRLKETGHLNPVQKKHLKDAHDDLNLFQGGSDDVKKAYKGVSDEVQARLVEKRSHLSQAQMDRDPFYKKYEVSPEEMIDLTQVSKWHSFDDYLKIRDQVNINVKR